MGGRKDRLLDVRIQDPYLDRNIYKDPSICPSCDLVFHNKTWHRDRKMLEKFRKDAEYKECPACRKIKDNYPLGLLILRGGILEDDKKLNEILNLIKHEAERELNSNPLARVMKVERREDHVEISTTTEGLATRLGKALSKAHQGELEFIFSESDKFLRVIWTKD